MKGATTLVFSKKVFLIVLLLILSGSMYGVSSYSQAIVSTPTALTVTTSENALISIPDSITFNVLAGESKDEYIKIANRLGQTIYVEAFVDNPTNRSLLVYGGSTSVTGNGGLPVILDAKFVPNEAALITVPVTYKAVWGDGSAEIQGQIVVRIEPNDTVTNAAYDIINIKQGIINLGGISIKDSVYN